MIEINANEIINSAYALCAIISTHFLRTFELAHLQLFVCLFVSAAD